LCQPNALSVVLSVSRDRFAFPNPYPSVILVFKVSEFPPLSFLDFYPPTTLPGVSVVLCTLPPTPGGFSCTPMPHNHPSLGGACQRVVEALLGSGRRQRDGGVSVSCVGRYGDGGASGVCDAAGTSAPMGGNVGTNAPGADCQGTARSASRLTCGQTAQPALTNWLVGFPKVLNPFGGQHQGRFAGPCQLDGAGTRLGQPVSDRRRERSNCTRRAGEGHLSSLGSRLRSLAIRLALAWSVHDEAGKEGVVPPVHTPSLTTRGSVPCARMPS
jgi:hypothetical protein